MNNLLDPLIIAQLGSLELKARRILDGLYSGHHATFNRGASQEFSEHRPYNMGDDLKQIDWKIFGRTDRLVVKQYEEETNIVGTVVVDNSASMAFSWEGRPSKLDYAKSMAAAIGYLLISQHDAVGLVANETHVRPQTGRGHLDYYFSQLDSLRAEGAWTVKKLTDSLTKGLLSRKSLLILFSDLMNNPDDIFSTLRFLSAHKHEILVFQLLDPAEMTLPFSGPSLLQDMETNEILETEPEAIRSAYHAFLDEKLTSYEQLFRRSGIDYRLLKTNMPFDQGMGTYLSWRAHL